MRELITTIQEAVSLPIMIQQKEDCIAYAIRLTPMDRYGQEEIKAFLSQYEDYIYVNEISKKKKPHTHAVVFTKLPEEEVRDKIRKFLAMYFKGAPKRGDANKQYNLSEVEDQDLSVQYLLKDAVDIFTSPNINLQTIEKLKKKAYKKFSKEEFAVKLEDLKKMFKEEGTDLGTMMAHVVRLKALYRQPVNLNYINQLCISYDIHNKPFKAEDYVRDFLCRYI